MERTFSPMIRQFSAIDGLQKAYTLVYSMDTGNENGCCLTLCRTGNRQYMQSCYIAAAPEFCYRQAGSIMPKEVSWTGQPGRWASTSVRTRATCSGETRSVLLMRIRSAAAS